MNKQSYAIIGTGAVGGLYGSQLQKSGHDVHFLARGDYDHIKQHGLKVESPWGDTALASVSVHQRAADMPPCDVVCVCLKTTSNALMPELLAPIVHADTVIMLMQNGLGAEEEVAASFPEAQVLGSMCFLCSNKIGPGHIKHIDYGKVLMAAHQPGRDQKLEQIRQDFTSAGIPVEIDLSLRDARWRKLVWNIPYNGLSVVLNAPTDRLMAHPPTRTLIRALMLEVIRGNQACGGTLEEAYADELMAFTDRMKPYQPSMKLDYDAGRALETEYIHRRPLAAAAAAGINLPLIDALAAQLEFLDTHNPNREPAT